MINVPNAITIGRAAMALGTVSLLWNADDTKLWWAFGLTVIVIWGDGLDGYFARKLNQASKMGAILDIAGDRVVEMTYWVAFAALNWIPVWVPLLFVVRGTFVDAIRSQASEQGYTAFGEKTMMQSPIGKFIVASNFMRFSYAIVKAVAFCLIIAANTTQLSHSVVPMVAIYCVYLSALFCVLRGLPVLFEGKRLITG